jgi:carbon monoxide dehydrogenase subunit G
MELSNEFEVSLPFDEAWAVLTDLARVAPCLPGAQMQATDGDEYLGTIDVKVGPITAHYEGTAHIVERDVDAGRVVLVASGRDTNGQGTASASITALLHETSGRTHVSLLTDVTISGKVAQFGGDDLADVSARVMAEFVANLASMVAGGPTAVRASGASATPATRSIEGDAGERTVDVATIVDDAPVLRAVEPAGAEPVDVLGAAGTSALKRLLPFVVVGLALALLVRSLRRRRRA